MAWYVVSLDAVLLDAPCGGTPATWHDVIPTMGGHFAVCVVWTLQAVVRCAGGFDSMVVLSVNNGIKLFSPLLDDGSAMYVATT